MDNHARESIPVFKKWTHWYVLVLIFELALIVAFAVITKYFA